MRFGIMEMVAMHLGFGSRITDSRPTGPSTLCDRTSRTNRWLLPLVALVGVSASGIAVAADSDVPSKYQDLVDRGLPGYRIVSVAQLYVPEDMDEKPDYQTLLTGDFDGDGRLDLAAIVLGDKSGKRVPFSPPSGVVICFDMANAKPDCRLSGWGVKQLPINDHLVLVPAHVKLHCWSRNIMEFAVMDGTRHRNTGEPKNLGEATISTKTMGVGVFRNLGNGDVVLLNPTRTTFLQCIVSD